MLGTGSPLPESEVAILRQDGEFTMENAIPSILEAAVLGDLILLWRTWALWQDRLLFMIGPMVLWVASFATFLTFIIMYGTSSNFPFIALIQNGGWDAPLGRLQLATWLLSMLTNLVATMTITYKAWQHRSMIKMSFNESTKRSQIGNILALMIEPGCFYFVLMGLQIMQIVGQFDYGPVDVFHEILNRISEQFYGLYPTVIIVLVELQRTIWDSSEYSSSNQSRTREAGVISSIRFTATAVLAQYSFGMETMGSLPDV
ncbi:hypothetical protein GYMLUDRAFT_235997 [Collybiopsis luxurians FD-317 M1]|nr:hypothetical protein GYMLUDRAFT_235997 [Collybiopsis luxurians FD-317 M1]